MEEKRSNSAKIASSQKTNGKYKEGNPQAADKSEHNSRRKGDKKLSKKSKKSSQPTAQKTKKKKRKRGEPKVSKANKKMKKQESLSNISISSYDPHEEEVKLEKESDSYAESK